jgi:hypothetical protein
MEGLNRISLNNSMLADLYGHSLVNEKTGNPVVKTNNVMVVTKGKMTQAQHDFLMQVLSACKLDPAQVSVLNSSDKSTRIEKAVKETSPRYILSFGTGDGTELFTMGNSDGRKYLNAPALDEMMHDTDASRQLKRKMWTELKNMFGIQ